MARHGPVGHNFGGIHALLCATGALQPRAQRSLPASADGPHFRDRSAHHACRFPFLRSIWCLGSGLFLFIWHSLPDAFLDPLPCFRPCSLVLCFQPLLPPSPFLFLPFSSPLSFLFF